MFCIYIAVYSPELTVTISTGSHDETEPVILEQKLISSFAKKNNWREGRLKLSFNYLLLDASVTQNLPRRMNLLG
jgi:hypothetical protein